MTPSEESQGRAPVHMGSTTHMESEAEGLRVTWASFPTGAVLVRHTHDRATVGLMLDGGFDLAFPNPAIRRDELHCGPGTIFTEPAGEPHVNRVFDGGASVVVIQPAATSDIHEVAGGLLDRVNHFRDGGLQALARRLRRELVRRDPLSRLGAEALALEILVGAARVEPRRRAPQPDADWLRRAEDLVHDRFREKLTIREIASEVGVHPAHLAAEFRRRHGVPLGTYIRRLRLEWAAGRLSESTESISLIAHRAGFADQAHLTRSFKRYVGTTPGRFRRERGALPG